MNAVKHNSCPVEVERAERRARDWLSSRLGLEYVERPPASAMYGLDPAQEWVFRIHDQARHFVGCSIYVTVNRVTGRVTEVEAGE